MKESLIIARMVVALSIMFSPCLCVGDGEPKGEADRIAEIAGKLQVSKPLPGDKADPERTKFCRRLLQDLKAQKNVEFVQPLVRTDNYDDPKLQEYLGKCPNLKLNRTVSYEPRIWEFAKTLPEDQREELGTVWLRSADFRLYPMAVAQTDPAAVYAFFGGGNHSPKSSSPRRGANFSSYTVVDFTGCSIVDSQQVGETVDLEAKRPTGNLNGIIRYRGELYLYNALWFEAQGRYSVQLYTLRGADGKVKTTIKCSFVAASGTETTGGKR